MKPLTSEQLREMDGQPVKFRNLENPESKKLPTGVVTMYDPNDSDNGVDVGCGFYSIREYGRTWVAYPYFKIDRDAFEGCINCADVKQLVKHIHCWPSYCPVCGHPMTESAWNKLEERIRGCLK